MKPLHRISVRALLASERTFLAWLRTAVTVMAFGFVVSKFDLFLRSGPSGAGSPRLWDGGLLGVALVGVALVIVVGGAFRYWRIRSSILRGTADAVVDARGLLAMAVLLVIGGVMLALYLWETLGR